MAGLIEIPSVWDNLGQGFQVALQNAMMMYLLKKFYPELFNKNAFNVLAPTAMGLPRYGLLNQLMAGLPNPKTWQNIPFIY